LTLTHHRIDFFEKIAPYYDILLDLLTFGLYANFLRKGVTILAPKKGEKILDLCSGTGRVVSWIAEAIGKEGEVIGVDISKNMVEVARKRYGSLGNVIFLQKDVTEAWGYRNYFDGIFTSFALHELPESERSGVLEQCYLALKERGRLVIAEFNPQISGMRKTLLLLFFKLFERENLNFFFFEQRKVLERVGFRRIRVFTVLGDLLQITFTYKSSKGGFEPGRRQEFEGSWVQG